MGGGPILTVHNIRNLWGQTESWQQVLVRYGTPTGVTRWSSKRFVPN